DDRAAAGRDHARSHSLNGKKLMAQIDGYPRIPIFRRDVRIGMSVVAGRVVDENVDGAESGLDLSDRSSKCGDIGQVARKKKRCVEASRRNVCNQLRGSIRVDV